MTTYLFKRVDIHYTEIEADSIEEANAAVRHLSCTSFQVETAQGEWEVYGEEEVK